MTTTDITSDWPEASRLAAQRVIDEFGEPHEATGSQLIWFHVGDAKRIVARREFAHHDFPVPHTDSIETTIAYRVPLELAGDILSFNGSVCVNRTRGELREDALV